MNTSRTGCARPACLRLRNCMDETTTARWSREPTRCLLISVSIIFVIRSRFDGPLTPTRAQTSQCRNSAGRKRSSFQRCLGLVERTHSWAGPISRLERCSSCSESQGRRGTCCARGESMRGRGLSWALANAIGSHRKLGDMNMLSWNQPAQTR